MAVRATDWSVVVVGAWNTAILTPDGVRRRILELPEDITLEIEVNIDQVAPARIKYDGIIIAPNSTRLVIGPLVPESSGIQRSADLAKRAIQSLPETPFAAVGINFNYQIESPPDEFVDVTGAPIDDIISDAGYEIKKRDIRRALSIDVGLLNFGITRFDDDGRAEIKMNFEVVSKDPDELCAWLGRTEEFISVSNALLGKLKLKLGEGDNDEIQD